MPTTQTTKTMVAAPTSVQSQGVQPQASAVAPKVLGPNTNPVLAGAPLMGTSALSSVNASTSQLPAATALSSVASATTSPVTPATAAASSPAVDVPAQGTASEPSPVKPSGPT